MFRCIFITCLMTMLAVCCIAGATPSTDNLLPVHVGQQITNRTNLVDHQGISIPLRPIEETKLNAIVERVVEFFVVLMSLVASIALFRFFSKQKVADSLAAKVNLLQRQISRDNTIDEIKYKVEHYEFLNRISDNIGKLLEVFNGLDKRKGMQHNDKAIIRTCIALCSDMLSFSEFHFFQCVISLIKVEVQSNNSGVKVDQKYVDDLFRNKDESKFQDIPLLKCMFYVVNRRVKVKTKSDKAKFLNDVLELTNLLGRAWHRFKRESWMLYNEAMNAVANERVRLSIEADKYRIEKFCENYNRQRIRARNTSIVYLVLAIVVVVTIFVMSCWFYLNVSYCEGGKYAFYAKMSIRLFAFGSLLSLLFWLLRMFKVMLNCAAQYEYKAVILSTYPYFKTGVTDETQNEITLRVLNSVCSPLSTGLIPGTYNGETETNTIVNLGDLAAKIASFQK